MSTNLAYAESATRPVGGATDDDLFGEELLGDFERRSPIEIVTSRGQKRARPRIVYALVATAALFVLLLTQLGISIAVSDGAYELSALQTTQTAQSLQQQKYQEKLDVLSSPQNIANNATALGMVRNQNPVYLDLTSGTVYGSPTAAVGSTTPTGASTTGNLVPNSLLSNVPVVTKKADSTAAGSTAAGAATPQSTGASVASTANKLTAPETR